MSYFNTETKIKLRLKALDGATKNTIQQAGYKTSIDLTLKVILLCIYMYLCIHNISL